jgi:uncharacterized membrane protein
MSKVEDFLTQEDEQAIVEAIRLAEMATSGEIRVHIEQETSLESFDRAKIVFHELRMDETDLKNGVLIYIAVKNKSFAICGDKGINDLVPHDFWDCTKEIMATHFRKGDFRQGLIEGINNAGQQLKKYFPYAESDNNELSNEISRG